MHSSRHAHHFIVEEVAVTTKNYYSGGLANAQRLTRGIGWVAILLVLLFLR